MKNSPELNNNEQSNKNILVLDTPLKQKIVFFAGAAALIGIGLLAGPKAVENFNKIGANQEANPVVHELEMPVTSPDSQVEAPYTGANQLENEDSYVDPRDG